MTSRPDRNRADARAERSVDAMRERFVELCTAPLPEPAAMRLRSFLRARSPSERAVLAPGVGLRAAARTMSNRTSAVRAAAAAWRRPSSAATDGGLGTARSAAASAVHAAKVPPPAPSWEAFRRRRDGSDAAAERGDRQSGDGTLSE